MASKLPEYRQYVGGIYDIMGASQFNLLTGFGLREWHTLLDIGCGSLRSGRLFIPYLNKEHYFGVEPERWLVEKGIEEELGKSIHVTKKPAFLFRHQFEFSEFKQPKFDYLLAQSVFSHATKDMVKKCMAEASGVMHDQSIFLGTYFPGEEDNVREEWYQGRVYYRPKFMSKVAADNGLRFNHIDHEHPRKQQWFLVQR